MKKCFQNSFVLCVAVIFFLGFLPSPGVSSTTAGTKATLNRFPDPVLIKAESLSSIVGGPISDYRIYTSNNGELEPIRFQIDEMTEEGDFIFPFGKENNKKESNGILDPRDIVLFMAHDAGDRIPAEDWPKNISKGVEIKVNDPIDNTSAWTYLFLYDKNPPKRSSLPNYFNYDYDTETMWGEYWKAQYIITEDGRHTSFYKYHSALPKAGGTGENYVDRLKLRVTIKLFFGKFTIDVDEESIRTDVLAWIQGPVRVIRRLENYAKGPFNMKLSRGITDVQYYETLATVPVHVFVPFKMESVVTSTILRFGTDYDPMVKGSMFYNSSNPDGVLIDGKMGEAEKNFNSEPDTWRVITGKWGSLMTRSVYDEKMLAHVNLTQGVMDDETYLAPPEALPGAIGWTYQELKIHKLPGGRYTFYLEFYTPPNYKRGDEKIYLNYLDEPLNISINGKTYLNQVKLLGNPGETF